MAPLTRLGDRDFGLHVVARFGQKIACSHFRKTGQRTETKDLRTCGRVFPTHCFGESWKNSSFPDPGGFSSTIAMRWFFKSIAIQKENLCLVAELFGPSY